MRKKENERTGAGEMCRDMLLAGLRLGAIGRLLAD